MLPLHQNLWVQICLKPLEVPKNKGYCLQKTALTSECHKRKGVLVQIL